MDSAGKILAVTWWIADIANTDRETNTEMNIIIIHVINYSGNTKLVGVHYKIVVHYTPLNAIGDFVMLIPYPYINMWW